MSLGNIKTESDLGNLVDGNDWDEDNEGIIKILIVGYSPYFELLLHDELFQETMDFCMFFFLNCILSYIFCNKISKVLIEYLNTHTEWIYLIL